MNRSITAITPRVGVEDATNDFVYVWTDIPKGMSCSTYRRTRARARVSFWKKLLKL